MSAACSGATTRVAHAARGLSVFSYISAPLCRRKPVICLAKLTVQTVRPQKYRYFQCTRNRNFRGTGLAFLRDMNYQCQHCGQFIMGKAYRVTSEEAGVRLLDMTVCYYCFVDAQRLGLHTEEISTRDSPAAARYQQSFT